MVLNLKSIYFDSWKIFAKDWWKYIVVSLIMLLLSLIPIIGTFIQLFITLIIIKVILKSINSETITFNSFLDIKSVFKKESIIIVIALGLLSLVSGQYESATSIAIIVSILLFVFSIVCFPIMTVLVDKNLNLKDTFIYSAQLTKGVRFELLLILIIDAILAIIGILILFIGIFVAIPIIITSFVIIYKMLENKKQELK